MFESRQRNAKHFQSRTVNDYCVMRRARQQLLRDDTWPVQGILTYSKEKKGGEKRKEEKTDTEGFRRNIWRRFGKKMDRVGWRSAAAVWRLRSCDPLPHPLSSFSGRALWMCCVIHLQAYSPHVTIKCHFLCPKFLNICSSLNFTHGFPTVSQGYLCFQQPWTQTETSPKGFHTFSFICKALFSLSMIWSVHSLCPPTSPLIFSYRMFSCVKMVISNHKEVFK